MRILVRSVATLVHNARNALRTHLKHELDTPRMGNLSAQAYSGNHALSHCSM